MVPQPKKKSSCLGTIVKGTLILVGLLIVLSVVAQLLPKKATPTTSATPTTASVAILVPTATPATVATTAATAAPADVPTVAPAAAPVAQTRCLDVPDVTLKAIEAGLKVEGGGTLDPTTAKAVQSKDFQKAFFIAAAIHGPGMGDAGQVGVWASNDLAGGQGMIFAVNAMAVEFSNWGDGSKTQAGFTMASDGANDAQQCVAQP